LEIFRDMQARSVPIDSLILNAVLATGVAAGKMEATEALLHEVATDMRLQLTGKATNAEIVDVISYNTVLKGYAHQKIADRALKILDLMFERGLKPNGITFNTVMDSVVRGSQPDDAWKVLGWMQEAGIQPDKFTCTIMLKGLHEDSTPKQLSMVIDMIQRALPLVDSSHLRSSLFHGIIAAAARLNNTSLLMRAFAQMQEQKVLATSADYQLMLQVLAHQGKADYCSTVWRQVIAQARSNKSSQDKLYGPVAVTVFKSVMEELANKDSVEGMICAFESLREVVMADEAEKHGVDSLGSQKGLKGNVPYILQQCSAALMQTASRKQNSSPALRRLLELAPEHGLPHENLKSC